MRLVRAQTSHRPIDLSLYSQFGVAEFSPDRQCGTEATLTYESPGGKIGELFAKLFGEEPAQQIAEDLRRFKSRMETGTVMTIEGQPSGREPLRKTMAARA